VKLLLFVMLLPALLCPGLPFAMAGAGTAWANDDEERRLWLRAKEEEKKLDESRLVYKNAAMEQYLEAVVRNLVPADRLVTVPIRVSIIRNRSCNAFIFPNGRIYIHSGMLAAMENEAQLATILGHECVHALNRHMLREIRDARDKTAISAVVGAITGNVLLPLGQLGALASISGYSRELETEADREGFRLLVRAGYDPREATKIFAILQKEAAAEEQHESFFFASHPKLQARIDSYDNLLKGEFADSRGGATNADGYMKTFGPLLLDSAEMDLKAGRFERARSCLRRYLAASGDNARAYFLLGETCRQDMKKADTAKAREHYQKAALLDPEYAEPHRAMGLLAYKQNDREQARRSLERYLALAANAPDRRYIEEMLQGMR